MVHIVRIRVDRGNNAGDFDDTSFGWNEHSLCFLSPARVVERNGDREAGYPVEPVVWIWKGGETILGFGAREDDTTDVYHGGQTGGDNIVRENLFGTSVRTDHLELY